MTPSPWKFATNIRPTSARCSSFAGETKDAAARNAEIVLAIETDLAKPQMDNVARRDPKKLNNKMSLDQLQAVTPTSTGSATSHSFTRPRRITHRHVPRFLQSAQPTHRAAPARSLEDLPTVGTSSTNPRRIFRPLSSRKFQLLRHTLSGTEKLQPRWRRCVRAADRDLGEVLGQAYVARASARKQAARSSISSTTSNPPSIRTSSPSIG